VIGGICYTKWKDSFQSGSDDPNDTRDHSSDLGPLEHAFPLIGIAIAVAVGQASIWLWMMQKHGQTLIWASLIFGLIMSGAAVILAARAGSLLGAVLAGIFFLLNLWSVHTVNAQIGSGDMST
jgi:hypothetical protein